MVVIRLARQGRTKYPVYRIVAADKRRAATSKFLAILGKYNPHTKEITIDKEAVQKYLDTGAQASDRVLRLLQAEGVELPKWAKTHDKFKKPKKEAEPEQEQAREASDTPVAEVAEEKSEAVEAKAEEVKNDVGTAAEIDNEVADSKAQEAAGDAAVKAAKDEVKESK